MEGIDITFDGADEVDPQLDLIKGYGGALVREKIVAASSRRLIILVGAEKLVPGLGTAWKAPGRGGAIWPSALCPPAHGARMSPGRAYGTG